MHKKPKKIYPMKFMPFNRGFTLIELLVVIAIVGILSGLITLNMNGATESTRVAKLKVYGNSVRDILGNNLVSEWKFESGSHTDGQSADTTDLKDTWSTNDSITVSGPLIKEGVNCVTSKCLYFDGSNDYIDYGNDSSLDITGTKLTMAAWIYPTKNVGYILAKNNADYTDIQYGFYWDSDRLYLYLNGTNYGNSGSTVPSNTWSYVAITYDGVNVKYYVDGIKRTSPSCSVSINSTDYSLNIGRRKAACYFGGKIDDIRIYNIPIPVSQIQALYLAGLEKLLVNGGITQGEYYQRIAELNNSVAKE